MRTARVYLVTRVVTCVTLAVSAWQPAFGWGDEGHRITGHIANAFLLERTRHTLRTLIGTDDLSTVATWMDDEREMLNEQRPGSSRWHYENRPACGREGNSRLSCPKGQCLTQQIERLSQVLHDPNGRATQRAEAVRMLVHLLGDLHQPLHLSDNNDRGGNDIWVRLPREREPRRLHEVWDTRLVRMNTSRRGESDYARLLTTRFTTQLDGWQTGTLEHWASDAYLAGKEQVYALLPGFSCRIASGSNTAVDLPTSYVENARGLIDIQLARAGVRIAVVLNRELGSVN